MIPSPSPVIASPQPRVLIAEEFESDTQSLIRTCHDSLLNLAVDHCASPESAVSKVMTAPYQLIIGGARMAERKGFFFLNSTRMLPTYAPFIVTASAADKTSAGRVLDRGAFDLLTYPLEQEQAILTIRLALWHQQIKTCIAGREKALAQYRQHLADYPGDQNTKNIVLRALSSIEKTLSCAEITYQHLEASMGRLSDLARQTEFRTKQRAFERLDALFSTGPPA